MKQAIRRQPIENITQDAPHKVTSMIHLVIVGVVVFIALLMLLSLVSHHPDDAAWSKTMGDLHVNNWLGAKGAYFSDILFNAIGRAAWLLPPAMIAYAYVTLIKNDCTTIDIENFVFKALGVIIFLMAAATLLNFYHPDASILKRGGVIGQTLASLLNATLTYLPGIEAGSALCATLSKGILLTLLVITGSLATGTSPLSWIDGLGAMILSVIGRARGFFFNRDEDQIAPQAVESELASVAHLMEPDPRDKDPRPNLLSMIKDKLTTLRSEVFAKKSEPNIDATADEYYFNEQPDLIEALDTDAHIEPTFEPKPKKIAKSDEKIEPSLTLPPISDIAPFTTPKAAPIDIAPKAVAPKATSSETRIEPAFEEAINPHAPIRGQNGEMLTPKFEPKFDKNGQLKIPTIFRKPSTKMLPTDDEDNVIDDSIEKLKAWVNEDAALTPQAANIVNPVINAIKAPMAAVKEDAKAAVSSLFHSEPVTAGSEAVLKAEATEDYDALIETLEKYNAPKYSIDALPTALSEAVTTATESASEAIESAKEAVREVIEPIEDPFVNLPKVEILSEPILPEIESIVLEPVMAAPVVTTPAIEAPIIEAPSIETPTWQWVPDPTPEPVIIPKTPEVHIDPAPVEAIAPVMPSMPMEPAVPIEPTLTYDDFEDNAPEILPPDDLIVPTPNIIMPKVAVPEEDPNRRAELLKHFPMAGQLPSLDLLADPPTVVDQYNDEELDYLALLIEEQLSHFSIKVAVANIEPGPVITRFSLELAPGVKVSQINNLEKDIARGLSVTSVRVVEIIPGTSYVGLEIPNRKREIVYFKSGLESQEYQDEAHPLTLILGKDISGNTVTANLGKMPHVLVAGTTGSGKSVGVNTMLLSMLFKALPEDLRLILIDPKMLELSVYNDIPHLLTPVVTDMKESANALRWCVAEMERRYQLMSQLKVRNIAGFNQKIEEAIAAGDPIIDPLWRRSAHVSDTERPPLLEKLPFIVVVIDEFADMMMLVGKKCEELIARLAQKARASGIHLILATQRPSVDVITGLIKANIPTRIAFQVSSKIDSRTIIDQQGAETLLGHGDMLYMPPGNGLPIRVHGAFVEDAEVNKVVEFLKLTGEPDYVEDILHEPTEAIPGLTPEAAGVAATPAEEQDPLFDEAVKIVVESRRASISYIQRKLRVGYQRAARLMEEMEELRIVTPPQANGNREVILAADKDDY
ncbi:hypothetical protein B9T13_03190 [Wohlfahrtiimonas chitiniclastica]|uniref:DNA translocase FtsK n=1 Tax=Wohlfahrtiimonas chitiniclastica TaxID=400946 RepID=UPI000B98999A|nr:DNA translocase FtsK 4TM domain-containing protein [Wohlfahrtiimonas chitiniclastica]OYQ71688.1 hypothetical protein B9T13_03190 [Wohlfahrtiimonas chitiniclastica]